MPSDGTQDIRQRGRAPQPPTALLDSSPIVCSSWELWVWRGLGSPGVASVCPSRMLYFSASPIPSTLAPERPGLPGAAVSPTLWELVVRAFAGGLAVGRPSAFPAWVPRPDSATLWAVGPGRPGTGSTRLSGRAGPWESPLPFMSLSCCFWPVSEVGRS